MRSETLLLGLAFLSTACGGAEPPPQAAAPPAPSVTVAAVPPSAPIVTAPAAAPVAPAASALPATAPNAEDAPATPADYAEAEAKAKAEKDRFTPELREKAKALAETKFKSTRAGLDAILKSPHRKPGNPERDVYRHPVETLEFLGITPKMTVLEYGPGEGWYTELLAPLVAKSGKLIVTTSDASGPPADRGTLGAKRFALFLDKSPELFGKVESVLVDGKHPSLPQDGTLDAVIVFRGLHGMERQGTVEAWLAAFHKALKPQGILGIEQHRAHANDDPKQSAEKGYVPEPWVITEVEKAGFKLAGKSEVNANPKDTKDYPEGVWTLPPTLRLKDKDRDRYVAIGESDRMTLKFVKTGK